MAWQREEDTGWWNGNGSRIQFDPYNPGRTGVARANGEELYTEWLPWDAQQAKDFLAEAAYLGLAGGNRTQAVQSVQDVINASPDYWAGIGLSDPNAIADYTQQSRWRRLTNQDDDKLAPILNNLWMAPLGMGIANWISGASAFGGGESLLGGEGLSMDFPLMSETGGGTGMDLADWWAQDSSADWMSQWEGGTPEIGTPTPNGSGWPNLPPGMSQLLSSVLGPAATGLFGGGANSLFGPTATGGMDWGKILGGLIGYKMTDDLADKYFTKAGEIADKYKRPWDEWLPIARQMRDDPQGYMNQYWKPMIGQFTDEAARKAAAGGFNNSGSGVNQIADTVTNRSMQSIFNPNYDANLKAAGLYQSPSTAAGIEGDLTSKGLGVVNQANSNLGFAAREATSGLLGGSRQSTDDIYNNIMKTFFS